MKQQHDFFEGKRKKLKPYDFTKEGRLCDEQEDRVAKRTGGKKQPASGSKPMNKGDVLSGRYLVEAKTSGKKSIRVSQNWLEKISDEAVQINKVPALTLGFPNMRLGVERDWLMIPMKEFIRLKELDEREER